MPNEALRDCLTKMAAGYVRISELEEVDRLATESLRADLAEATRLLRMFVKEYPGLPREVQHNLREIEDRGATFLARVEAR